MRAANLATSDLRGFGNGDGKSPARPTTLSAVRGPDQRNARIAWARVPGAVGSNVRWRIRPDRLNLTYQLFADSVASGAQASLELSALDVGQRNWVAVAAFDDSGVSRLTRAIPIR